MVYFIAIATILFGIYRYDYCGKNAGRLLYWCITCAFLICIAGLRYRLGQDTFTYIYDYAAINPVSRLQAIDFSKTRFAPGYVVLTSVFKEFTDEFTYFQFFQALLVNTVFFYFFYKHCRHIFFAALVYFFYLYFLMSFQQMREAFAVCIFLLSWSFFRDGRWLPWYIASLLAFMFHISAFIMFFLPLICLPGIRQLFVFGGRTWLVAIGVALFGVAVQAIFFQYVELIAFSASMMERVKKYEHHMLGSSILNFNGVLGSLVQYIIYPLLALFFIQKRKRKEGENVMLFNRFDAMVLMSVYVAIFSISVSIVARLNNYFFPFAIIALSDWIFGYFVVYGKKVRLRALYWILIFLPMFAFHISGTYFRDINKSGSLKSYMVYYPYSSILDRDMDAKTEKTIQYLRRKI